MRTPLSYLLIIAFVLGLAHQAQAQIITTIAGNGTFGNSGDGGPAIGAQLIDPWIIAFDSVGNIYVSDYSYDVIRKVDIRGNITTIAGTGTRGSAGNGGPASAAQLSNPSGVSFDGSGNMYISEAQPVHRIRKINTSGIITTIAGTGTAGYNGDNIPATAARLNNPCLVTADFSGNLYFIDNTNRRVRKISTSGIITTVAGTGTAGYNGDNIPATTAQLNTPNGIALDASGNLYIGDFYNSRIRKINTSGIITTVAGTGTPGFSGDGSAATAAQLYWPCGLWVDLIGNIFSTDNFNERVRKVDAATGIISTIAGTGTAGYNGDGISATAANLRNSVGIVTDAVGSVYIADAGNYRIRMIQYGNHLPSFDSGASVQFTTCADTLAVPINNLLAVTDSDHWQLETWTTLTAPLHGTLVTSVSATSPGFSIIPAGTSYKPAYGYTGPDTFRVRVSDGQAADTISVYVNIIPSPAAITGTPTLCAGGSTTLSTTSAGGLWSTASTATAFIGSASGIFSSPVVGTARVSYTFSNGCSARQTLTVNPLPAAITGAGALCVGQNITVSNATVGGNWTSSNTALATVGTNGRVAGISSGVPTITFALPTGCIATTTILVNPTPATPAGTLAVCPGLTTTLSIPPATGTSGGTWTSSTTAIATVSTSGPIAIGTGISAGTSTISYTLSTGCASSATFTVYPLPPPISGTSALCIGSSATLSNGTSGGTWSSSSAAISLGSTASAAVVGITGASVGSSVITYTSPLGCVTSSSITVNTVPPSITGPTAVCAGQSATLSNAATGGSWSATGAASVGSATGIVTGFPIAIGSGTAAITYSLGSGCTTTTTLVINNVSPISGPTAVCSGSTITLTSAGSSGSGTWSASSTAVSVGSGGIVTGMPVGTATGTAAVTYTSPAGCTAFTTVTVQPQLPIIGSPAMCVGHPATFSNAVAGGNWSRSTYSNVNILASGVATGLVPGTTTIYYTLPTGCMSMLTVTVSASAPPISGTAVVCPGATSTLSVAGSGGTWTSGSTAVSVGISSGVVSGISAGTAVITYSSGSACSSVFTVTVSASPPAIVGPTALCGGATATLSAGAGGTWASGNTAVVGINTFSGAISGLSAGTSVITFTNTAHCTTTATVSVSSLAAVFGNTSICTGGTTTLSTALSSGGTWASSLPAVATIVPAAGICTGVAVGTSRITYTSPAGCVAIATVSVGAAPSITGTSLLCSGQTTTLSVATSGPGSWTASGPISLGAPFAVSGGSAIVLTGLSPGAASIAYSSGSGCTTLKSVSMTTTAPIVGNSTVCPGFSVTLSSATPAGVWNTATTSVSLSVISPYTINVSALASGPAAITYTGPSGCTAVTTITVNPAAPPIIGNPSLCVGQSTTFSNASPGGTWTRSTFTNITISSSGVAIGMAAGTTIISYILPSGCMSMLTVTAYPVPAAIAGSNTLCVGGTTTLSIPAGPGTSGGYWSAGSAGVVTVSSASGMVTGIAVGTDVVSYILPSGCPALRLISVNPVPIITGPSTLCMGNSATLSSAGSSGSGSWFSSSPSIASIGVSSGIITASLPGSVTIAYSSGSGCNTTTVVTVHPIPAPITGPGTVCIGATVTLSNPGAGGAWSPGYGGTGITLAGSTSGIVTGVSAGIAVVVYTSVLGCVTVKGVTVNPIPAITGSANVCLGARTTLSAVSFGPGIWSAGSTLLTVGVGTGIVTGIAVGTANVTYSVAAGCSAVMPVTVDPLPPPFTGAAQICGSQSLTLSDAVPGGYWESGDTSRATVDAASGIVTGVTGGLVPISYTAGGCYTVGTVTVATTPGTISGIADICAWGNTITVHNSVGGGSWSSTLVSINVAGLVTSFAPGVGTITYVLPSSCFVTSTINVNPLPLPISGPSRTCVGQPVTLTDGSPSGTWSASATTVCTIGSLSGSVSGIVPGSSIITYTLPTGCTETMSMTITAPPTTISGTASMCVGASATLSNGTAGGTWSSGSPGIATIGSATHIAVGLSAGSAFITYYLSPGCLALRTVTVLPTPVSSVVTGGGSYCAGGTGVHIGIATTTPGADYTLFRASTPVDTISGTGSALDFGLITTAGVYTVSAVHLSSSCRQAMSDSAVVVILPIVTPSVTLSASPDSNLCQGTLVNFTATPANGGTSPAFQYSVNGINVGTGGPAYSFIPTDGNIVRVVLTSSAACPVPTTAATEISITVDDHSPISVALSADRGTIIDLGQEVTFTARVTGGGTPTYQWFINSNPIAGATSSTYTSTTLLDLDTVKCIVTSGNACHVTGSGYLVMRVGRTAVPGINNEANTIHVFPNPSSGVFTVTGSVNNTGGQVLLELKDMLGHTIYFTKAEVTNNTINHLITVKDISPGIYLLQVVQDNAISKLYVVIR